MEAEEPPRPRRGGTMRGQRFCVTGLSLADRDATRGQPLVTVWAEVGHEALAIGMLWSEQPLASVPPLELDDAEFVLRHDSAWSSVRLYGYYLDPPDPDGEGAATRRQFLVVIDAEELPDDDEEEEVEEMGQEYEPLTEEDLAERYDSDNGEDEDGDGEGRVRGKISRGRGEQQDQFLGPPRFAAVKNTAGFTQIAAAEAATGSQEGREIVVLYRYTRFSRTWSGWRGVEACRRTKLHWLRFAVPPAGDMAGSLAWAGSSLSPLIYPGLFRRELRDLWSSLAAAATTTTTIPPHAARLQLRLPEPVRREGGGGGDGDDARPAKRRRVATAEDEEEEECALCLDPLESGLAAWPGCRHEFHGECVEKTLARSEACPLCRRKLSDALAGEAIQSC
ncbi:hypothetical protein C2845_PM13G04480 [Panicum miliaceum]|uniref:RING-type domain-containing protein n=1 Tax=Panicum miliaceum TaxID=4540 RepID=A0A3L6RGR1_PANMI|nr:hypothetical protein C2845_PM13G04480 [Panicum miliaceum]